MALAPISVPLPSGNGNATITLQPKIGTEARTNDLITVTKSDGTQISTEQFFAALPKEAVEGRILAQALRTMADDAVAAFAADVATGTSPTSQALGAALD